MDQKTGQSARLAPLPPEHSPDLKGEFDAFFKTLGFVPNSVLTMQRKPKLVRAFVAMQAAIWDPASKVDRGLKRLIAHMASRAAQDPYSMAHTASGALHFGITPQKLDAVADYRASPLYSAAEKAALAVAEAAAAVPNAVDDALFAELAPPLGRGGDRRDHGDGRDGGFPGALERHHGDAARSRAARGRRQISCRARLGARPPRRLTARRLSIWRGPTRIPSVPFQKSRICMRSSFGGLLALLLLGTSGYAQTADKILFNGKIVTVDDRFTIAQALAISGERIVAVGSNADIEKLKTSATEAIDLQGKTVIPGLIDNHAHFMRAAEYWDREVRLDGVATHRQALDMIAAKAAASKPGEWVLVLGGWSEEQFTDEKRGFGKAELDAVAPNNPVALQLIYFRMMMNSAALAKLGIDASTPDPRNGKIDKDANGQPTGILNGGGAVAWTLGHLGEVDPQRLAENARALMHDLNKAGLTAYQEMGGRGISPADQKTFATLADARQLTVRIFYNYWNDPSTPAQVDQAVARIAELKPFRGDDWFDMTGYGETTYFPLHDNLLAAKAAPSAEGLVQVRRVMQAVADRGMSLNVHAQLHDTIEAFLTEIEAVDKIRPIKALRWTFSHADQLAPEDLDRLRRLGMAVELHSRPSIQGGLMLKVHGDKARDMPPLRLRARQRIAMGPRLGRDRGHAL